MAHPPLPIPIPHNESERLRALHALGLLDTSPDPEFDRITALACYLFRVPISMISLVDHDRQWFKSYVGMATQTVPRNDAFCAYTILDPKGMVVNDARNDARFAENPLVLGAPGIRFYAGVPLMTPEGYALGTVCIIDTEPRSGLDEGLQLALEALSREVMAQASLRYTSAVLAKAFIQQKQDEIRRSTWCAINEGVAAAPDLVEAYRFVIAQLCEVTGWSVGAVWMPSSGNARTLRQCKAWYAEGAGFETLRERAVARRCAGVLAQKAWRQDEAVLLSDLELEVDEEWTACLSLGIKGAAAFPLISHGRAQAILEFLFTTVDDETPRLFRFVSEVIAQLGDAFERKEQEARRREHETELRRVNRVKDHFLALLAHELRNPMAPILNAVALLRTPDPGDALEVIERQVNHMARLVDDLLDISRVSRGKITLQKGRIDLTEAVQAAVKTAESAWQQRAQGLRVSYPTEPLWVEADPVRIEQIVGNLLNNAVKYTPPDGVIALALFRKGDEACIEICDEGIGVSREMQKRIFEPFVQTPESQGMTRGGLGLGLDLVKQLVRLHGGSVEVFSEGVGKGSSFSVFLPLMADDLLGDSVMAATPAEARATPGTAGEGGRPVVQRRVLIAEDNPDLARTLQRLLTHWGHTVEVAVNSKEALAKALEFRPEVALIDIGLPGSDGYTLAGQMLAQPRLKGLRLIAMTGYSQPSDRSRAAASGFQDFLLKPIDPALLRDRLQRV